MKRKVPRITTQQPQKRERMLFFDIVRILCIAVIVYDHVRWDLIPNFNQFLFPDGTGFFNIYTSGLQGYAVYGLIVVSGAVLEYNYRGLEKVHEYLQFLFRRFIRIYPAFWMSLIFGLIAIPVVWQNTLPSLLFEFTGFFVVLGLGPGNINNMGWFIAAIVSLYLLFPWFSKIMRRYGFQALIGFCIISWGLRFAIITYNLAPLELFWRWFPLCNAFEFCLGIYIVQAGLYPKKANTSSVIKELSDVSYYVFLFHVMVSLVFINYLVSSLGRFDMALVSNNLPVSLTIFYLQMLIGIFVVSWIAMKIDSRVRSWVLQLDMVRNFLKKD
jgi:peptidoglycan/LPS O-acetylase OafA/YrhL